MTELDFSLSQLVYLVTSLSGVRHWLLLTWTNKRFMQLSTNACVIYN